MKAIGIIPARWASTRFEGKVLAEIAGKPMIQHVWERAKQAQSLDDVWVACDDKRVFQSAEAFGAKAVMTSDSHPSGTDRIAEAVKDYDAEIVVNIQGDEPLIHASVIDELVEALAADSRCSMSTTIKVIDDFDDIVNANVVKVVTDNNQCALYFSRAAIPHNRDRKDDATYYKHLGIYAYRKDFLMTFSSLPESVLEHTEKLEQLRVLAAGYKIKTVVTEMETLGVDTPEDLKKVQALFV